MNMAEEITCECGWHGTTDDLLCNVLHEESGRTTWVCPKCGNVPGLATLIDELNEGTEGNDMMKRCCLCGRELKEIYECNNPWPLADESKDGPCCPECNQHVITARLLSSKRVMEAFGVDEAEAKQMIENAYANLRMECKKR